MNFYKMVLVNQYTGVVNNIDKCYHVHNGENTEASKWAQVIINLQSKE